MKSPIKSSMPWIACLLLGSTWATPSEAAPLGGPPRVRTPKSPAKGMLPRQPHHHQRSRRSVAAPAPAANAAPKPLERVGGIALEKPVTRTSDLLGTLGRVLRKTSRKDPGKNGASLARVFAIAKKAQGYWFTDPGLQHFHNIAAGRFDYVPLGSGKVDGRTWRLVMAPKPEGRKLQLYLQLEATRGGQRITHTDHLAVLSDPVAAALFGAPTTTYQTPIRKGWQTLYDPKALDTIPVNELAKQLEAHATRFVNGYEASGKQVPVTSGGYFE